MTDTPLSAADTKLATLLEGVGIPASGFCWFLSTPDGQQALQTAQERWQATDFFPGNPRQAAEAWTEQRVASFQDRGIAWLETRFDEVQGQDPKNRGYDAEAIAESLAGCDTPRAHTFRVRLLLQSPRQEEHVLFGLAGCTSLQAGRLRRKLIEAQLACPAANAWSTITSLIGLESRSAWNVRVRLDDGRRGHILLGSLMGCASPRANEIRESLWKNERDSVIESLAGCDTPEAWALRERFLASAGGHSQGGTNEIVAKSLSGCRSERAWAERKRILAYTAACWPPTPDIVKAIIRSLAGIESPQATDMREQILHAFSRHGCYYGEILASLQGCDGPDDWEMRRHLLKDGATNLDLIHSLAWCDSERAWNTRESLRSKRHFSMDELLRFYASIFGGPWKLRPFWRPRAKS